MKYYLSTIADVSCEEGPGDWEKLNYNRFTAPLAKENGLGIEIAEFCISDNMDLCFDDVLPHAEYNASMAAEKALHAPYNELFPMAIDRRVADIAWDRYDQSYGLCARFGAGKMIVHANYFDGLYFKSWFVNRHVDFWKRFLEAHPGETGICMENVREPDPEIILEILRRVDDPRLKMCLDIGHANLTETPPEAWLAACAPYVSHYHLHNNNGAVKSGHPSTGDRHAALGDGTIDMKAVLEQAEKLTPDATAAVESYALKESIAWLRENRFI